MVRSAIADEYLQTYLVNLAKQSSLTIGLILGQSSFGRDYIIHFAKTPPCQTDELKSSSKTSSKTKVIKTIGDVNEAWVADHARHATRMLPGGMHVLGIFIISQEDLLTSFHSKLKSTLSAIHNLLGGCRYLYGNLEAHNEKLVLNYCLKTSTFICKSYDVITNINRPADFKFSQNANRWSQLECKYEMDQVYHVPQPGHDWSLKKHMSVILDNVNENLKNAVFLYDGEIKESEENLDNIGKKKKMPRSIKPSTQELAQDKAFQVSILQSCNNIINSGEKVNKFEVLDCDGQIRIVGQVACKLWLHPKVTIKMASEAVTQDIMRSLATRLEMHWDSLTEEEGSSEDVNSIHEPPRRVLVALPNSKITLSDYLFPGEGPQDAQLSLQEMLDIKIANKNEIQDVEGQADLTEYYTEVAENDSEDNLPKLPTDTSKFMYISGLVVALVVLIISLIIHFFK